MTDTIKMSMTEAEAEDVCAALCLASSGQPDLPLDLRGWGGSARRFMKIMIRLRLLANDRWGSEDASEDD